MIRRLTGLSALLIAAVLTQGAKAPDAFAAPLAKSFQRLCLTPRPDFVKSEPLVLAQGFTSVSDVDDISKGLRKFTRESGDQTWTVVFADRVSPNQQTDPPQRVRACMLSGPDADGAAAAQVRAWLGVAKPAADGDQNSYPFVEAKGQRTLIKPGDGFALAAALKAAGFWNLSVSEDEGQTTLVLVLATAAPAATPAPAPVTP